MLMRYRFPELFDEKGTTPWLLAKASDGRIPPSSLYRLAKRRGEVTSFDGPMVEAICATLGVGLTDVLELDKDAARPPAKRTKR